MRPKPGHFMNLNQNGGNGPVGHSDRGLASMGVRGAIRASDPLHGLARAKFATREQRGAF
jgi:hypothetical protein